MADAGFYATPGWKAARRAALRRDGYRCTVCGVPIAGRGQARVDHIQSVRTRPDLALTLANLRSLCVLHDNQAHREKWQGKGAKRDSRFSGCDVEGKPFDAGSHWYKVA